MKLDEHQRMGVDTTNQIIKGIGLQKMAGYAKTSSLSAVDNVSDSHVPNLVKVRELERSFVSVTSSVDAGVKISADISITGVGKTYCMSSGTSGLPAYADKQNSCDPEFPVKAQTTSVEEQNVNDIKNEAKVSELKLPSGTAVHFFNRTEGVHSQSTALPIVSRSLQIKRGPDSATAVPKSSPASTWLDNQDKAKTINSYTSAIAKNSSSICQTAVKHSIPINVYHGFKNNQVKSNWSNSNSSSYSLLEDLSKRWLAVHRRNQMQDSSNSYKSMYNQVNNCTPAKRKYHTVSDSYIRYLNKPKWAKHEALEFKAVTVSDQSETVEKINPYFRSYVFPCDKNPLAGIIRPKKRPIPRRGNGLLQYRCSRKRKRTWWKNPSIQDRAKIKHNQEALFHPNRTTAISRMMSAKLSPSNKLNRALSGAQYFSFPSEPSKSAAATHASNTKKPYERIYSYNRLYKPGLQVPQRKSLNAKHMMQNSYKTFQKIDRNVTALQQPSFKTVNLKCLMCCSHSPEPKKILFLDDYQNLCVLFYARNLLVAKTMSLIHRSNNSEKPSAKAEEQDLIDAGKILQPYNNKGKTVVHSAISLSIQAEISLTTWSKSLPFVSSDATVNTNDTGKNLASVEDSKIPEHASNPVWFHSLSDPDPDVQVDINRLVLIAQCFGIDKLPLSEQARISWNCDDFTDEVLLSLENWSDAEEEQRTMTIEPKNALPDVNCDRMSLTYNSICRNTLHSPSSKCSSLNRSSDCCNESPRESLRNGNDLKICSKNLGCKRNKIKALSKPGFCIRFRNQSSKFNCFFDVTSCSPAWDWGCWFDGCFPPISRTRIIDLSYPQPAYYGHDISENITLNSVNSNSISTSVMTESKSCTIMEQRDDSLLDNHLARNGVAIIGHSLNVDRSNTDKENPDTSSVVTSLKRKNGLVKFSQQCPPVQYYPTVTEESEQKCSKNDKTQESSSKDEVKSRQQYILERARAVWLEDIYTAVLEEDDGLVDPSGTVIDYESSKKIYDDREIRISNSETKPASQSPCTIKDDPLLSNNHSEIKSSVSNFLKTDHKVIGSSKHKTGSTVDHETISATISKAKGQSSNSDVDTESLKPKSVEHGVCFNAGNASNLLKTGADKTMGSLLHKLKQRPELQHSTSVKADKDGLPCIKDEQMRTKDLLAVKIEPDGEQQFSSCDKVKVVNCVKSNMKLPAETASTSQRSRSKRSATKRCRYEQDYVTELPKSGKRPKKTLARRNYENYEFWNFYQRCQNSEHSKNLVLQHKYITLLKDNEIDMKTDTNHNFSWVPSLRMTNGRVEQKFNRDGLPSFMSHSVSYTKGSVLLPNPVSGEKFFITFYYIGSRTVLLIQTSR